jgi:polar amino acid transport system substrate-binding protein
VLRLATTVALALLLTATARGQSGTLGAVIAKKVLRVGMHPGLVPFVAVGADADEVRHLLGAQAPPIRHATDGRGVCGFDVELAAEAARALGVELQIVLVDRFDDLLPGLQAGRYELVLSGLTRTVERARTVAFSDPYFASGLEILVRDPARFPTLESLRRPEVKLALRPGTTAESFARSELGAATVVLAPDVAGLFALLHDPARADAAIVDFVTARDGAVRGRLPAGLSPVEERRFTTERFAIAVRQGDPDWLGWLNLLLGEAKSSGQFHRLAARFNPWFRNER